MSNSNREPTGAGHDKAAAAATKDRIAGLYHNSAIARVVGKKINRRRLISRLNHHLRLTTPVEVIELNGGYFVLTFSEEDYSALERLDQPWSIPYLCIHTISWIPDFRPSQNPIHVVNAWVRLHELPVEKYGDLQGIAKLIGDDFVGIDPVTKSRLICKYARICVTLDLRKPLQSSVLIEGKLQEVEYEGFDLFSVCPGCERVIAYCLCSSRSDRPIEKDPMLDLNSNEFGKVGSSLRIDSPVVSKQSGEECEKAGSSVGISPPDVPVKIEGVSKQKEKECVMAGSNIRISSLDVPVKIQAVVKQKRKECENAGLDIRIDSPHIPLNTEAVAKQIGTGWEKAGSGSSVGIKSPDVPVEIEAVSKLKEKECENAGSGIRLNSQHVPLNTEALAKQIKILYEKAKKTEADAKLKGKFGVSVSAQPLPNFPKQSSTVTIKAPQPKHVVPSVADQFQFAKNSNPSTLIANHNNQLQSQPSSPPTRIPTLQPRPSKETNLEFYSAGIQRSTRIEEITNTPCKETVVDGCPTVYMIKSNVTSLGITLSEVHTRTTMVSNQNQYAMDIVPTSTGGDKGGVGSKVVSGSESCSKMLVWKFHGTENANLKQALKDLIQLHNPSIILIIGTKISGADADQVVQELPFRSSYCRKPDDDYNGGVWLLLSRENVQVEVNSCSQQRISASIHFPSETVPMNSPPNVGIQTSLGPWGGTFFCTPTSWMSSEACR